VIRGGYCGVYADERSLLLIEVIASYLYLILTHSASQRKCLTMMRKVISVVHCQLNICGLFVCCCHITIVCMYGKLGSKHVSIL